MKDERDGVVALLVMRVAGCEGAMAYWSSPARSFLEHVDRTLS